MNCQFLFRVRGTVVLCSENLNMKMARGMIGAVVLLCLVSCISAGPIPKEFEEIAGDIRETCLAETGASIDLIEGVVTGNFVEDPKLKCYLKCLFDQFRLISSKGFNFEAMVKVAPPSMKTISIKLTDLCKDIKIENGDICDFGFRMSKCFYNNFPEEYFIM